MTTAKITKKEGYRCAPTGAVVEHFAYGDIVTGKVAECALEDHAAARMFDPRTDTQAMDAPETKADAPKKRGRPRKAKP